MPALAALALLVAAGALHVWSTDHGLRDLLRLRREVVAQEEANRRLREENLRVRLETEALKTDRPFLDQTVREELRMIRPDEVLVQIPPAPASGAR